MDRGPGGDIPVFWRRRLKTASSLLCYESAVKTRISSPIVMWSRCSFNYNSNSRVSANILSLLLFFSFLCWCPGLTLSAVVTLQSIEIYKTHEWLNTKPTVYFSCGENKTILPDVKEANVLYNFRGEESWQPLTELSSKKCKRCGFYEQDLFKLHDTFDEWELCPSDFAPPDGKYTHVKDGELNATFLCPECLNLAEVVETRVSTPSDHHEGTIRQVIVILVSVAVAVVVVSGL
ncbi:hypothetical protein Dimus_007259, partial [Dionaea muscipula]